MNKRQLLTNVNSNLQNFRISYSREYKEYRVIPNFTKKREIADRFTHFTDSFIDAIETAMEMERAHNRLIASMTGK